MKTTNTVQWPEGVRPQKSKHPQDMDIEDMLDMQTNTSACFDSVSVMRVPGGWIYEYTCDRIFILEPPVMNSQSLYKIQKS